MGSRPKDGWIEPEPGDETSPPAPTGRADTYESVSGSSAPPSGPAPGGDPPGAAGTGSGGDDTDAMLDEALAFAEADTEGFSAEAFVGAGNASLMAERDDYRDALLRVKADFDNYRKRVAKDQAATVERAAEKLVADLLPVLDACEAALGHGAADVEPIFKSLLDVLEKGGLTRMSPEGQPFDPNLHEAVLHEPGDEGGETVVVDTLRTGYLWNGRVVRAAMVKVRG